MARTAMTVQASARTQSPPSVATAITATTIDGALVTAGIAITDFFYHQDAKLVIYNTAGTLAVTLVAGTGGQCIKKDQGDKVIDITTSTTQLIDQIESARFDSADGDLWLDFEAGFTGTIYAIGTKRGGCS